MSSPVPSCSEQADRQRRRAKKAHPQALSEEGRRELKADIMRFLFNFLFFYGF
jgi:hypothetical protein